MVRIRLRRVGGKHQPSYRIVVTDKESPRDGRFIEILGSYNPRTNPATIQLEEGKIYGWMSNGAQPTESVAQVFKSAGLLDRYDRYKNGEALETLLGEAQSAESARNINSKTNQIA
jgi:small subunit ribosomal protein S16